MDKFILKSHLKWIPYNKFKNVEYLNKGGFGTIYKAIWLDKENKEVALKCLNKIHKQNLIHCDFHDGNILNHQNKTYVSDLGLCHSLKSSSEKDSIYGVMPFMAPEILRGKPYTSASDIYSFSMIMWEFTSGSPPFDDRAYDHHLSLSICKGERPKIIENTPSYYIDLMKECWDPEPFKRPTIKTLENIIS